MTAARPKIGRPRLYLPDAVCAEHNCTAAPESAGLCMRHYAQRYRRNRTPKTCIARGCHRPRNGPKYCRSHERHIARFGQPRPIRAKAKPNAA